MSEVAKQAAPNLAEKLADICGEDHVLTSAEDRAFFTQDLYERGSEAAAIVAPADAQEVARVVRLASAEGLAVHVRGGGMSYSRAFFDQGAGGVLIDTRRLNRIREINPEDGYAIVDAGVTWQSLDEALKPHGMRAIFWGPFSGGRSTIGGSMSQGTATFGSGQVGTSAAAALGFEIVTSDGQIARTGMDAQPNHSPFFRPYGPDLTGLFTGDAGALGVKTGVALALEKRPAALGGASYSFTSFDAMLTAMADVARLGLVSEMAGMDAAIAGARTGEDSLIADVKRLWAIIRGRRTLWQGLKSGMRTVVAGRRVFREAAFLANFTVEGGTEAIMEAKLDAVRQAAGPHGQELPDAAVGMIRANPFPDLPVTHFDGRRLLPIHGLLPYSRAKAFRTAFQDYLASVADRMAAARVSVNEVCTCLGRHCLLFEPCFYWEDSLDIYHERMTPAAMLEGLPRYPENPEGRALVEEMRQAIVAMFYDHGAGHLQIGRAYPFSRDRNEASLAMLKAIKQANDGAGVINPGALGL